MEQELYEAIERALADKRVKNIYSLCEQAGVNQPSVSTWIKTKRAKAGSDEMPSRPKETIHLDVASRLIECLGGSLIFPDTDSYPPSTAELAILKAENEKLRAENLLLDKKLYACEQMREKFEEMVTRQLPAGQYESVEARQNKSSA